MPRKICGEYHVVFLCSSFILISNCSFCPECAKSLAYGIWLTPQRRFTKYYTCQLFNRITECGCVWRISWWIIGVNQFLVQIYFFSYKHQVNRDQPQLCLIWNLIFSKSTWPTPMILCLKFYLEQACSFDIWKCCSDLLVSEISSKMSSPNFSLDMLVSFILMKRECMKCEKR